MFSPALRHRQKLLAERSSASVKPTKGKRAAAPGEKVEAGLPDNPYEGPVADEYRLLLIQLHEDLRTLSGIQSIEQRIARKPEMLGKFKPWIDGVIGSDAEIAVQDEIVVTGMIWALDIGSWETALDIAAHCIKHGLALPERYNRTLPCLVVEEIAEAAIKKPGSVPPEIFTRMAVAFDGKALVELDMPDQVKAKLYRALGESLAGQAEAFDPTVENAVAGGKPALVDAALAALRRALELDAKVGVKKHIEQLERQAKALAAAAGQDSNEGAA